MNYHCPYCAERKEVKFQCRLKEEIKAKEEAELRAKERMEKEREDRGRADNVAGAAYEFWTLMGEIMEELSHVDDDLPFASEPPVPSPDSITVTTEFGVSEEPSNITIITGGLPTTYTTAAAIEEIEDLALADNSTAPPVALDFSITLQAEDMADDEGEEAALDGDDFDAESALIDEFIDDGVLTPTTSTTTGQL